MRKNFWKELHERKAGKPIIVLAPMADVTDPAFRRVIAKYSRMGQPGGGPDVLWTEFVSADGLCSPGRSKLIRDLEFSKGEHPIVAQLFTSNPENMEKAAALCQELGFDGIDINMGCPDKSIEKQCAGAAMMRYPEKARAVIQAALRGAPNLPVSVKTRIGYSKNEIATWIPELLKEPIAVLTIHCRTRKEMSDVPARWEHVKEVIELRDKLGSDTLIFGNGDVKDLPDAYEKAAQTGAQGVMLGRAIFGNPWLFDGDFKEGLRMKREEILIKERLEVLIEHTNLYEQLLGDIKSFAIMKKHFKAYVGGWDGAKEFRMKLMDAADAKEVEKLIRDYIETELPKLSTN